MRSPIRVGVAWHPIDVLIRSFMARVLACADVTGQIPPRPYTLDIGVITVTIAPYDFVTLKEVREAIRLLVLPVIVSCMEFHRVADRRKLFAKSSGGRGKTDLHIQSHQQRHSCRV